MRGEIVRAERFLEIRDAANGWKDAGSIDERTRTRIEERYPEDRTRLKLWLRIVALVATILGGIAASALVGFLIEETHLLGSEHAVWAIFAGLVACAFVVATEWQRGPLRRAQAGTEEATAVMSVLFAVLAVAVGRDEFSSGWLLAAAFVSCVVAAWRWGDRVFSVGGALFLLCWLARAPHGRAIWVVVFASMIPFAYRAARNPWWAPSHRRIAEVALLAATMALYAALNLLWLDQNAIEMLGGRAPHFWPAWLRLFCGLATAIVPVAVLLAGIVLRNRIGLVLGAAFLAASLATLRHYRPIAPLWLALTLCGVGCLSIALALRRWLDRGEDRERAGFTAEPLFENRRARELAQIAGVAATLGPAPRATAEPSFRPGGGTSGGGGAAGTS